MRKKIVAGNWKMNLIASEADTLSNDLLSYVEANQLAENIEVIVSPPYLYLEKLVEKFKAFKQVKIAAQNCHAAEKGAFTGEVSIPMLKSIGVDYTLVGHSERRAQFNETGSILKEKVDAALAKDLKVIFCCGEALAIREANRQNQYVLEQLQAAIFHLAAEELKNIIIAYEPVWAIGTGKTASAEQAQEMHAFIRKAIERLYDKSTAENLTILYGGSCKPSNAASLFSQIDVDGGLIGGASLSAEQFVPIIEAI